MSKELGLMLYWGEGDKTKDSFIALTNTDPNVLAYFVFWFRKYFDVEEKRLKCRLYIWEHLDEQKAKTFWSKKLKIPLEQFTKSYIYQSISKVRKRRHEFGACRVSYGSKKIMSEIKEGIKTKFMD